MISEAGFAVLSTLSIGREMTPDTLAAATATSRTQIYNVLNELAKSGLLLERRGSHNQRQVRVADHAVTESYRHLISALGHVEWPALLSPATVRVCWYLDQPRRVTTIADRLSVTRQAVYKALRPLKDRAMFSPSGPEYALSDDLQPLVAFVKAVVLHEHRSRVREIAPGATIEWCDPKRALVRAHTSEDTAALQSHPDWQLSGLAQFQEYGLQFYLSNEPAFWYAPDETITPAETVCHTLVLECDSRRASYAMLLIQKAGIDQSVLTALAEWYDLSSTIEALYQATDTGVEDTRHTWDGATVPLPSKHEYAALKQQYDVA